MSSPSVARDPEAGNWLSPSVARPLSFWALAALLDALLGAHLYLRAAPLGGDFALRPTPYLLRAVYYGLWAHALVALPFLLLGFFTVRSSPSRRALTDTLQIGLTALLLLIGGVDREFQRFLGTHVSAAWLSTYAAVEHTPRVIWRALAEDRGGSWSSLWGIAAALAYVPLCVALRRVSLPRRWFTSPVVIASGALVVLLWPTLLWNFIPGGVQRQNKVRPALLTLLSELRRKPIERPDDESLKTAIDTYQSQWLAEDAAKSWVFDDARYPLRKHHVGPKALPKVRPNFILLSLETFRAKDMSSFNRRAPRPSATPFLDSLATDSHSALYPRHYASGIPTVFAFMSIHTGLLMHPTRNVTAEATTQHLEGFPNVLRRHGYHTAHFTGSDPDWDGQRVWLRRWYDEIDYRPEDGERDRSTFRRAAERLRQLGDDDKPFFASLSSISNHTPFHSPEPELDIARPDTAASALRNTMHYTDDVVRELYENLRGEPWFERTVWIITGDHGFDLGERGEVGGHDNLRHETTWVPLIVHGADPRLPRGEQARISSHIDLAPTVAELAGVYEDNGYMGHSLLGAQSPEMRALILRGPHYAYETPRLSLFRPDGAPPLAYAGTDGVQEQELPEVAVQVLGHADRLAQSTRTLVAYVVDFDRHTPPPDTRIARHE